MLKAKKFLVEVVQTKQIAQLKAHLVLEVQLARILVKAHKVKLKAESPQLLVQRLMVNLSHRR